jgi:hypothetical protein
MRQVLPKRQRPKRAISRYQVENVAFADYASYLKGYIPEIDILLCQELVNKAWKDIREARLWSWLRGVGVFIAPQNITTGTVSPTRFSKVVNLDATANAALNNLNNPFIGQRQFRTGQGPVYNIASYSNAGATLTLDRPFLEGTSAGQSYQVYRCYYTPTDNAGNLVTDFMKFKVIFNPVDGYAITGPNLNITRAELDVRDPTRGAQDLAYCVAGYDVDANGNPRYELWPHPTSQRGYVYLYQRTGVDLSPTVDIPTTFSPHILKEKTLAHAYEWAIVNQSRFPTLKGVDFRLALAESNRKYEKMLLDAKRRDDNIILDNWLPDFRGYMNAPIDSKFAQSHDVDWTWGG